ncbi:MAG: hypothetical protein H7Z12_07105 [Rhodospirillaceae bacterium]|nr:hypothetical protein [Rhodospirillales bacterium]
MSENEAPKSEAEPKPCCGGEAPKPKDTSKYDYRPKEQGQEVTRRKGCC